MPAGALFGNPEVVVVDLRRNRLTELPSSVVWLPESNSLDYLTVANNQISALGKGFFRHLPDLDFLDLSGNRLSALDSDSWESFEDTDLDNLLLVGNPFRCRIIFSGPCFCAGDCSNSTDGDEDGDEDDEDDEDDGPLVKVPASWCELPMCTSHESGNATSNASVSEASNASNTTVAEAEATRTSNAFSNESSNASTPVPLRDPSAGTSASNATVGGSSNENASSGGSSNASIPVPMEDMPQKLKGHWEMLQVYSAATKLPKEQKEGEAATDSGDAAVPEEQVQEVEAAMEDALPTFLKAAWSYVVRDIDKTVREVGRKFLQDKSVPWQIRIRRAQALQLLGQVFVSEGATAMKAANSATPEPGANGAEVGGATSAAKAVLQEAMLGAMREK
ncbi:fliI [Symbiodinium natans]|uniref:FliI protein n=1 Tax=Symbiodinium natans TaxID=878477 RepID=A0A812KW49_9DINO|nr:fliI [Symbiodinium natans]